MSRKGIRKPIKVISSKLWKERQKQVLKTPDGRDSFFRKKAAVLVRQLRRAAKKGKTIVIRKTIRNLAAARESGKTQEKIQQLEDRFSSAKSLDLDKVVSKALSSAERIRQEILPSNSVVSVNDLSPAEEDVICMVIRTAPVQQELKALSDLFINPEDRPSSDKQKKSLRQDSAGSASDTDLNENDSDSDIAERSGDSDVDSNVGLRTARHGSPMTKLRKDSCDDSESEPEDVSALIGERPVKNRPGQRTRRKMILQKYGANALVFQKERERKFAEKPARRAGTNEAKSAGIAPPTAADVHPSWAAKQRVKAQVSAAVRGHSGAKRIKLDDDVDRKEPPPLPAKRKQPSTESSGGKEGLKGQSGGAAKQDTAGKPALHPSWEAKLRAKEAEAARLAAAKAAKPKAHIKFDDD